MRPNEVYELTIKATPDSYPERYLCADFNTCLEMIDKFYLEYDWNTDTTNARYLITKRKILCAGDAFSEDELGECELGPGKVLRYVDVNDDTTEVCSPGHDCVRCQTPSAHCIEVCFPAFLPDRCAVRYRMPDGSVRLGIHLGSGEDCDCCYIIPLDGEMLSSRDHAAHWGYHWHEHIPHPNVEQTEAESLPEALRSNYLAFLEFLDRPGAPDIIRRKEA